MTPDQILLFCRPGFEPDLAAELTDRLHAEFLAEGEGASVWLA